MLVLSHTPPPHPTPILRSKLAETTQIHSCAGGRLISCMDWDARGQRLAVACGAAHTSVGRVALYSTSCQPVVTATYMGLLSQGAPQGSAPIDDVKFHGHYERGALLAVRGAGDRIDTLPLLFAG